MPSWQFEIDFHGNVTVALSTPSELSSMSMSVCCLSYGLLMKLSQNGCNLTGFVLVLKTDIT